MALRPVPNDVSATAHASLWVFRGPWMAALAVGCGVAYASFQVLRFLGVDLVPNLLVSSAPVLAVVAFVVLFVNGQAPSYPIDLFLWLFFRLRLAFYCLGILRRPPQLWVKQKAPVHFSNFSKQNA